MLQNAVERLLALPVEVSYTLPEMLDALGSDFAYTRRDYFHFPLGHGLRAEALHAAWYRGQADNLDEIRHQARLYLLAVPVLLRAVRERAGKAICSPGRRSSRCRPGAGIREPLLSRLAFFARYESLLRCLAMRESRAEARATQVLLGQVIELKAVTSSEMEVVGDLVVAAGGGRFSRRGSWCATATRAGAPRSSMPTTGIATSRHGGPRMPHRAIVGVQDVHDSGKRTGACCT